MLSPPIPFFKSLSDSLHLFSQPAITPNVMHKPEAIQPVRSKPLATHPVKEKCIFPKVCKKPETYRRALEILKAEVGS